ncbi:hypothetical protein [Microbacterium sp.]|uniref:hypothetical protein n=1 Tax=Microbacterium sp. TaxID=51671 RepID=UPI0039E4994D
MAGRTLTVDMADDHLIPAWRTVIELAESGVSEEWTLVGGLMVAAHARRAGVMMRRPTDDVDVLVDYVTDELLDPAHVSWVNVDLADRERGMFNLRLIRQVIGLQD